MATLDPKLIVGAAIGLPILYIWQKMEFSIIFLLALGIYAWLKFDGEFIHKSEQRHRENIPQMGPQQPFMPQEKEWYFDPVTGEPVAKYQPPPQQYRQPRQR